MALLVLTAVCIYSVIYVSGTIAQAEENDEI